MTRKDAQADREPAGDSGGITVEKEDCRKRNIRYSSRGSGFVHSFWYIRRMEIFREV